MILIPVKLLLIQHVANQLKITPNEIRDEVRKAYMLKDPTQPIGHDFPTKRQHIILRSFQELWYKKFDWLKYSDEKDVVYCFHCFFFFKKPGQSSHFGEGCLHKS